MKLYAAQRTKGELRPAALAQKGSALWAKSARTAEGCGLLPKPPQGVVAPKHNGNAGGWRQYGFGPNFAFGDSASAFGRRMRPPAYDGAALYFDLERLIPILSLL